MIGINDALAYAAALGIAAAIPGPGMTALVARSVGQGAKAGFAMLFGLIIGDLCYLSFAVFGLVLIAQSFSSLFFVIRWLSIAYLLYLAWQFWNAQNHDVEIESAAVADLTSASLSGLAVTLGNPKTIAFYLALLPLLIPLDQINAASWALILMPITIAVLLLVGSIFILGALAVRRILSSERAQRRMYRSASVAMAGAAGSMLLREF
ncbi:MAG: LysE family translocator [Granulosicoccus sp.]